MRLKKIFLSTYTFIKDGVRTNNSGPVVPMMRFFRDNAECVCLLEQPLPGSDNLQVCLTVWDSQLPEMKFVLHQALLLGKDVTTFDSNKTYFRLKLRDLFSNIWALFKYIRSFKEPISIFIGVESINAICGIVFEKFGLVEKTVYYVFDWAPDRYSNSLINKIYLFMDRVATYYSDATWNITYAIGEARKEILHYNEHKMSPQIYVPYSPDFSEAFIQPEKDIDTNLVIYAGGLIPENGPDILLEAFRMVLHEYHEARLIIIGGGELQESLITYVTKWNMQKAVTFSGYISDEKKVLELQSQGAIGVAPYPFMPGSRKPYGDVIKIRMYFVSGLVTVSTPVPPVTREIKEERLGVVTVDDSPEELAKGILGLLYDKKRLFELRRNVIRKAKKSTWAITYATALNKMGIFPVESVKQQESLELKHGTFSGN